MKTVLFTVLAYFFCTGETYSAVTCSDKAPKSCLENDEDIEIPATIKAEEALKILENDKTHPEESVALINQLHFLMDNFYIKELELSPIKQNKGDAAKKAGRTDFIVSKIKKSDLYTPLKMSIIAHASFKSKVPAKKLESNSSSLRSISRSTSTSTTPITTPSLEYLIKDSKKSNGTIPAGDNVTDVKNISNTNVKETLLV